MAHHLARESVILSGLVIVGRLLNFVLPLLIARWFGAGEATDAWFMVVGIPLFCMSLLQTAVLSTFNPILARVRARAPERLPDVLGSACAFSALVLGMVAGMLYPLGPPLIERLFQGRPETAALAIQLFRPLLILIPFGGLSFLLRSVLEISGVLRIAVVIPLTRGAVLIVMAALLRGTLGIHALPPAFVCAEAAQLLVYYGVTWRMGRAPRLNLELPMEVRRAAILFVPLLVGEAAVNLNPLVDHAFAARMSAGVLSTLDYADRLRGALETLISAGVMTVLFAHWSTLMAHGDGAGLRAGFRGASRALFVAVCPILAFLFALRFDIVMVLYGGGAFGPREGMATAGFFVGYLPGFVFLLQGVLAVRYLLVQEAVRPVVLIGFFSFVTNLGFNVLCVRSLGPPGLAFATSLNQALTMMLLFGVLHRRCGSPWGEGIGSWLIERCVVFIPMAGLAHYAALGIEHGALRWGVVFLVCAGCGAMEARRGGVWRGRAEAGL